MRVKVCKVPDLHSALVAEEAGADFIGLVFDPTSKAYVSPERAAVIVQQIRRSRIVGVFKDADLSLINQIASTIKLDYVQLDGNEPPEYAAQIIRPVIKTFRYDIGLHYADINNYPCEIVRLDFGLRPENLISWGYVRKLMGWINKSFIFAGHIINKDMEKYYRKLKPYAIDDPVGIRGIDMINAQLRRYKGNHGQSEKDKTKLWWWMWHHKGKSA